VRPHIPLNVRTIDLRGKGLCFTVQPTAGSELPEPVSMAGFSFQINQRTGRARIVVEYTYPDQPIFGIDGGAGPKPTYIQLPGLTYDQDAKTVVYDEGAARTVCANVRKGRFLLWQRTVIEPTGACVVSARTVDHAEDDGWNIRRFVRSILSSTSTKDFITAPGMWCQEC